MSLGGHYAKISQSQKDKHCMTPLSEVPSAAKLIETKVERWVPEAGGKGNGEFNGFGVSVLPGKSSGAWLLSQQCKCT